MFGTVSADVPLFPGAPGRGFPIVRLLEQRAGRPTELLLRDGTKVTAHNIAWGLDPGEDWEHLSLNIAPRVPGAAFEFVRTCDVSRIVDPATGEVLFRRPSH